jgi:hypothetical protein
MKRGFLFLILFLNLSVLSAFADTTPPVTILDRVAQSEAEQLDLQVPADTPAGHHIITIQISDNSGVITSRDLLFCKDTTGNIQWDNQCPDVVDVVNPDRLEGITNPALLPNYNPDQDPKGVMGVAVAALALLNSIGTASGSSQSDKSSQDNSDENEQEDLESIAAGKRRRFDKEAGWGDRAETYQWPLTDFIDREIGTTAHAFSKFWPLLSRTLLDGNYLRAIFGSIAALIYPVAIYMGLCAIDSSGWQSLPAASLMMLVVVGVGLLDAFAGFLVGYIFLMGVIVAGHFHTRHEILGTLGIIMLWFGPALIASSIRPLRRYVSDRDERWERITDYALASLLAGYAAQKMVSALPGLTGKQLAITGHANQIAIISGLLVIARYVLEDFSAYCYPVRNQKIDREMQEPGAWHKPYERFIKIALFYFFSERFIGNTPALWMGIFLLIIPMIADSFKESLPKSRAIARYMPDGALKTVIFIFIGAFFSNLLSALVASPHNQIQLSFWMLSIPGLIFGLMNLLGESDDRENWRTTRAGRPTYRLIGIAVYILLALNIFGVNLTGWIANLFK